MENCKNCVSNGRSAEMGLARRATNLLIKRCVGARVGVRGKGASSCGVAHSRHPVVRPAASKIEEGYRRNRVAVPVASDLCARRCVGGGDVARDQRGEGDEVLHLL